jgi:DNA-binding NtrC family response regulator
MSELRARSWPGNVRQLRTIIEAALVESDSDRLMLERVLGEEPPGAGPERPSGHYDDAKQDFDRRFYTALYARYNGNISQIAKAAKKQRATVKSYLEALGLRVIEPPPSERT